MNASSAFKTRLRFVTLLAAAILATLAVADRAEAFVYWANRGGTTVGRANLDGTATSQSFMSGLSSPCGVAVDGAHVYWGGSSTNAIGRADLAGTDVDPGFITGAGFPCGVAVDGAHAYWANTGPFLDGTTVGRANLDGTGVDQNFIDVAAGPCGIAVDGAHIYWTNFAGNTIGRAELDGTDPDPSFITGANHPCGVAVDGGHIDPEQRHAVVGGHVYWSNSGLNADGTTIGRASLDGTNVNQSFISGLHGPWGVAVNDTRIYWGSAGTNSVGRAYLDGTVADESFIAGAQRPFGVALDGGSFQFHFGELKTLKHKGFIKLPVNVPGPGLLQLVKTEEIKGEAQPTQAAGELILVVRARGDAKRRLNESGRVKVEAHVSFAPADATPITQSARLKLVKR